MNDIKNGLYHYTNADALKEIIISKKLRLTACKDAKNAVVETMALYSIMYELLNNPKYQETLISIYGNVDNNNLIENVIKDRENSYMACFSETGNNYYLWKYYANTEQGVVVEFVKDWFPQSQDTSFTVGGRRTESRLIQMEYNKDVFCEWFVKNCAEPSLSPFTIDSYKPECCRLENEIRLTFHCGQEDVTKQKKIHVDILDDNTKRFHLSYEPPVVEYNLEDTDAGNISSKVINKIICRKHETKRKVEQLFSQLKLDINVKLDTEPLNCKAG